MQPHGRYLARFLCPWDSPGKTPGVGCHFLLPLHSQLGVKGHGGGGGQRGELGALLGERGLGPHRELGATRKAATAGPAQGPLQGPGDPASQGREGREVLPEGCGPLWGCPSAGVFRKGWWERLMGQATHGTVHDPCSHLHGQLASRPRGSLGQERDSRSPSHPDQLCDSGRHGAPVVESCQSLSRVQIFGTPWTVAHQAPLSTGFSRQEHWRG